MKHAVVVLAMMTLWTGRTRAQTNSATPIETQSSEIGMTLIEPDHPQSSRSRDLPDAPIPVLPSRSDAPMPCPTGDGKPCALLGGRLYFRDLSHMTQHDKTWFGAMKNPMMLGGIAVNLGTNVWLYREVRACVDRHACRSLSNTKQLTMTVGLSSLVYFFAGKEKQEGDGNTAFALLAVSSAVHTFMALKVRSWR